VESSPGGTSAVVLRQYSSFLGRGRQEGSVDRCHEVPFVVNFWCAYTNTPEGWL